YRGGVEEGPARAHRAVGAMTVVKVAAFLLSAAVCALPGGGRREGVDEHAALVTVVAESAAPIRGLTTKDFVVKEGGQKHKAVDAQLSSDPLSVALDRKSTRLNSSHQIISYA